MRLCVATEQKFASTPDGKFWTTPSASSSAFWLRYLSVFEEVCIFARVMRVPDRPSCAAAAVAGPVNVEPLPSYTGPYEYLLAKRQIAGIVRHAIRPEDAVLLRAAGQISNAVRSALEPNRPYGVEVIGDPYVVFSPGVVRSPLRPFFRWYFVRQLARQCSDACAVGYVTESSLQRRYPANDRAYVTNYSSIDLKEDAFATEGSVPRPLHDPARIITIGSFDQMYKGFDVLVQATAINRELGLNVHVTFIGDGRYRAADEKLAHDMLPSESFTFRGYVPGGTLITEALDASDLFVLASRTEGLPRVLIEAMARRLPCVATAVGGIPELLPSTETVPPGDAHALAARIRDVLADPARRHRMSAANGRKAYEFHYSALTERRTRLYAKLREHTERWLELSSRPQVTAQLELS